MPRRHYQRRIPPHRAPPGPDPKARLARISALSAAARTTWFGLLGLIAFVGVTLMAHRDADFFAFGAATQLPLIGISVPTTLFFWVAPAILLANYGYFHLYLMALWDELATDPPEIDGEPLAVQIHPWLLSHSVLWVRNFLRGDGSSPRRVMGVVTMLISLVLSWLLGLVALGFFWVRSWPLHDEGLSLWILVWFVAALWIGVATGWATFLLMRGVPREQAHATRIWTVGLGLVGALLLGNLTWEQTESRNVHFPAVVAGGADLFATWLREDRRISGTGDPDQDPLIPTDDETERYRAAARALPVYPANLREARLAERPADWTDFDLWIRDARRAAKLETVDQDPLIPTPEEIRRYRLRIAALDTPTLQGRDLRRADLSAAFLPGTDLRDAALQGADLGRAEMQGADLRGARMQGAVLWGADLRDAACASAPLRGALAHAAFSLCEGLEQAQLEGVTGNASTLLPDGLTVLSCLPPDADILAETLALHSEDWREVLRALIECAPGERPRPTGRSSWECRFARDFVDPSWDWDGIEQPAGIPYVSPCPRVDGPGR